MPKYKYRDGVGKHRAHDKEGKKAVNDDDSPKYLKPGEVVELTPQQYNAFRDKFDPVEGEDNYLDPPLTPTQPQTDARDTSSPAAPGADKAAEQNNADGTAKKEGDTGAGAAQNSSNSATVPGKSGAPTSPPAGTTGAAIQNAGGQPKSS